jgi:hypothetical protein
VPAAAVIPAPIAYIKVVAVKKLVVEFLGGGIMVSIMIRLSIRQGSSFVLYWTVRGTDILL